MKQQAHWIVPSDYRPVHRGSSLGGAWSRGGAGSPKVAVLGLLASLLLVISGALIAPVAGARDLGGPSGSEGQGSLPSFASGTGLAFVGDIQDIISVLGTSTGTGEVEFYALDPKVSMAIISGDLHLSIDLNELLTRDVEAHLVLGDALTTGLAEVGYGAWNSGVFALPTFSVEVPLTSLYASQIGSTGNDLRFRALGHDGDQYDLRVHSHDGILSLTQILR